MVKDLYQTQTEVFFRNTILFKSIFYSSNFEMLSNAKFIPNHHWFLMGKMEPSFCFPLQFLMESLVYAIKEIWFIPLLQNPL